MKKVTGIALLCTTLLAAPAWAQHAGMEMDKPAMPMAGAPAAQEMTDGVVRTVDRSARKLTIKHGEIKNLDMMPMTMVFHVAEPGMLDKVKAGDKIRFTADEIKGTLVVKTLEVVGK